MNRYNSEAPYWITIAHLPKWGTEKINRLIVKIFHQFQMNLEEFFKLSETDWLGNFLLSEQEISDLNNAKNELANSAFLAEDLYSQGYEIISLNSPAYSKILKDNLKIKHAPPVLYVKGNTQILQENSIAIIGSRDA
ncbi:MAG: DNA-processing protein DprA, partial [Desulfamplus sp.]|nr:DNA-processing protein DprA [Desulfamplus sp.]